MPETKQAQPTQQLVDIQGIRDGVLILKNGSLRRIIMVSGVNFDLKSEEEQGLITYAYQNFLNALDFSAQIFIHSRKLNIEGYLAKLAEREKGESNELLKAQIAEYRNFIHSFVSQNAIMNKSFFVVVPYDPIVVPQAVAGIADKLLGVFKKKSVIAGQQPAGESEQFKQGLTQLDQRVGQVIGGLSSVGLQAAALGTEEVIEFFYNLYNPEEVEKAQLEIAKQAMTAEEIRNIVAPHNYS